MQYSLVTVGALLCLYALSLPNAAYPYKRIHVLEYMSLALAVRYVMSWKLQGRALLFFSVLATMAFGIHDELLQGIHPQRTYGLRDVTVDAVSALGGGLLWNGLALFSRPHTTWYPEDTPAQWRPALFYLFWLVLSVLGFILPLPGYKNGVLPYWILIPLTASLVFWALYHFQLPGKARYGCGVLSCQVFSFFCYPFVINAYSLPFY
ncbi:MAG: hypothetical protein CSA33_04235 [Desulfobulbus propionicus]|nr:MAG: hypothetical protein CSA33_04235 [Desulfobulbus propionicus]